MSRDLNPDAPMERTVLQTGTTEPYSPDTQTLAETVRVELTCPFQVRQFSKLLGYRLPIISESFGGSGMELNLQGPEGSNCFRDSSRRQSVCASVKLKTLEYQAVVETANDSFAGNRLLHFAFWYKNSGSRPLRHYLKLWWPR